MTCPVCASKATYHWADVGEATQALPIRKCTGCLSLFQYPLPDNPDLFYDEGYYSGEGDFSYQHDREVFDAADIVYRARLKNIALHINEGRFLDVGCSMGGFVRSASSRFDAYGIDVSQYAIIEGLKWAEADKPAGRFGGLYHGSLGKLPRFFSDEMFSVITLVEVAEHLNDPRRDFAEAFRLLKPGGLLLVQTANFEGWQAINGGSEYHYFLPGHLIYYTATGLKNLLRDIGFINFKEYIPVDFSLLAKLRKSRKSFRSILDYKRWWGTSVYHMKSYLKWRGRPLTSSYVLYAFKGNEGESQG